MAKVYVTKCVVKKDKKLYQKGAVIEGLTNDEIERGVEQHWLEAVGTDEGPTTVEESASGEGHKNKKGGKKTGEKAETETGNEGGTGTNTETGKGLENNDEKTLDQMSKEELKAEAERLGVKLGFTDSEDEIRQKIKEAKGAGV